MITSANYLPIDDVLPTILQTLTTSTNVILHAPPGAGKTTKVPLGLLDASWLGQQRILMLEPRRLAARAAAERMAWTLKENTGETVGYRIRHESKTSSRTRIEVVTEGVLTRILQDDPELAQYGCIIFDEFHERNLHADTGLALCLESQEVLRQDLRLMVMSATLDCQEISTLMHNAPVIDCKGQSHPVVTTYFPRPAQEQQYITTEEHTARAICHALTQESGSILVFLPGAGEIHRVANILLEKPDFRSQKDTELHLLYGNLSKQQQKAAIAPPPVSKRKVVLSTAIAETSLTIEGIRIVVDAGLSRSSKFSAASGMSTLVTEKVSHAAATQRRGRAGRLESGICYRLWSEMEHASLRQFSKPEITEADLTPLALELARWGTVNVEEMRWLTPPPAGTLRQARTLLQQLGALDTSLLITPHGSVMATLPMHPRLAHMLLIAYNAEQPAEMTTQKRKNTAPKDTASPTVTTDIATTLAALLEERDIAPSSSTADIHLRLSMLEGNTIAAATASRLRQSIAQFQRLLTTGASSLTPKQATPDTPLQQNIQDSKYLCGRILAQAFPDRIAQRQVSPSLQSDTRVTYRLSNGKSCFLRTEDPLAQEEFLAVARLDGKNEKARIWLAAPLSLNSILEDFASQLVSVSFTRWDSKTEAVMARQQTQLGKLILKDIPLPDVSVEAIQEALIEGIRQVGLQALPWSKEATQLKQRMAFMHLLSLPTPTAQKTDGSQCHNISHNNSHTWKQEARCIKQFPDVSDTALLATLETWLAPFLTGITKRAQFPKITMYDALRAMMDWQSQQILDAMAPTHMDVPSGSQYRIDYSDPHAPVLPVKLQEMFGAKQTPAVGNGKIPLTLHLLSPAGRPLQVTCDLASFWTNGYQHVRAEMRGRHPKHPWPEDPVKAAPTRKTNRQLAR